MIMFGKKKEAVEPPQVEVITIPPDFYAGGNPVIYKSPAGGGEASKIRPDISSAKFPLMKNSFSFNPAAFLTSRKFLIIAGVGLFVLFLIGSGIYYYGQFKPKPPTQPPAPPPISKILPPQTAPEVLPALSITSTASTTEATTTAVAAPASLAESALEFPSALLGDSQDLDRDALSDAEEELFKTDPGVPDTDGDGYTDGQEVYNLYNPDGLAPMRLIDSGLVKDYSNPIFNYKIYYPVSWALGNVDDSFRDVLFSTLTGENIEARVFDLSPGQSFSDWFSIWAPGQKFGDLRNFTGVFKESGQKRGDNLVYYFTDAKHVYVLLYHTTDSTVVNYRMVMQMMANSLRLNDNNNSIAMPASPESAATETPPESSSSVPSL